jgi:hypothetical protein
MRSNHDLGVFSFSPFSRYMRMQLDCISGRNAMMFARSIRAFVFVASQSFSLCCRETGISAFLVVDHFPFVFAV